ncbi:MAG: E3 binding domain-containing protein, partial [Chloroflexota bacterium]|nr:E3 binding domain-containing protein [Chloroflexota bacterium]
MATAIKMPQLGVTMTEAKVVSWLKAEGDAVRKGDAVATIETDKINAEVEASVDGVLRRIVAAEGTVVPVVGLLAVIAAPDEPEAAIEAVLAAPGKHPSATPARSAATPPAPALAAPSRPSTPSTDRAPAPATSGPSVVVAAAASVVPAAAAPPASEVRASPIARRLASDLGIDLAQLQGSGPSGRIVEADVRAATPAFHTAEAGEPLPSQRTGSTNGFVRASPLARRLAREHALELGAIQGSGPEGRVLERDVLAAATAAQEAITQEAIAPTASATPTPGELTRRETIKLEGVRRLVAERMLESLQRTAQLTLTLEADATALVDLRSHLVPAAKVYGLRPPTYTDLLVYLVARVLPTHPLL